jgi:hypothetical protein
MKSTKTVRWGDMCRAYQMLGVMKKFDDEQSPEAMAEAFRINAIIEQKIKEGSVVRVERGLYKLADAA